MRLKKYWQFALVGYPLEHSLSPVLHTTALAAAGLSGVYRLNPLTQASDLPLVLDQMRSGILQGINVTIPYKQAIIPYLDGLTSSAQAIGAVNTVIIKEDHLIGENTDAPGFWNDLSARVPTTGEPNQQALILGAGGAARAVVFALAEQGWQITVVTRRLAQAEMLVETLGFSSVNAVLWDSIQKSTFLTKFNLIVNTTPVGMFPDVEKSPLDTALTFPAGLVVYDLVYNPAQTVLLKTACAQGIQAVSGLGMLVNQAALAFEYWTGETASVEKMERAVQKELGLEEN